MVCSALADEGVAQFIDESFVFWAALGDSSNTASAARRLGAKRYPFFGVVHSSVLTEKSFTGVMLQMLPSCLKIMATTYEVWLIISPIFFLLN